MLPRVSKSLAFITRQVVTFLNNRRKNKDKISSSDFWSNNLKLVPTSLYVLEN